MRPTASDRPTAPQQQGAGLRAGFVLHEGWAGGQAKYRTLRPCDVNVNVRARLLAFMLLWPCNSTLCMRVLRKSYHRRQIPEIYSVRYMYPSLVLRTPMPAGASMRLPFSYSFANPVEIEFSRTNPQNKPAIEELSNAGCLDLCKEDLPHEKNKSAISKQIATSLNHTRS